MGCGLGKSQPQDDSEEEEVYRKKEPSESEQDKIEKNESEKIKNKDKKKNKSKEAKKAKKIKNSEGSEEAKDSKGTKKSTYQDNPDLPYSHEEKAQEPKRVIPSVQTSQKENVSNMQIDNLKKKTEPKVKQPATRKTSVTKLGMDDVGPITQQPTSTSVRGTSTVIDIRKAEVSPPDKFKCSHEQTNIDEETKSANLKSNDCFKSQTVESTSTVPEIPNAEFKVSPTDRFKRSHEQTNIDEETKPDSQQQELEISNGSPVNGVIELKPNVFEIKNEETNGKSEFTRSANAMKNKHDIKAMEKNMEQRLLQKTSDNVKRNSEKYHKRNEEEIIVRGHSMDEGGISNSHACNQEGEAEEFHDCPEENVAGSSCYASLDEDNSIKNMLYTTGFQECSNEPNHEISSNFSSQQFEENSTNHSESEKHSTEFKSPLYNRIVKNDDASCLINDANDLSHSSVEQMGERTPGNEELFHTRNPVGRRNPVGLRNLGNTCFFNSVMQNLLQTHALEDALKRMDSLDSLPVPPEPKKRRNKNAKVHNSSSKPLTAALVEFYEKPSPKNVFDQICNKSPRFSGGHQQDSHELLRHLMDGLRNEEKEMSSGDNPQKILTLVDQVFGGHYMTVYTCHVCTLPYHLCEPMLDISLPVTFSSDTFSYDEHQQSSESKVDPELEEREKEDYKDAIKTMMSRYGTLDQHKAVSDRSVEDCLQFFTREELLDEYLCMACYNKRQERGETELVMTEATKQTLVYNPPAILTLHLKRFEQTARGFKKANNPISFEEILDLGPFCSLWSERVQPNQKNIWYSLYGVVVHGGSLSGGHYVAYVKARNCDIASLRGFQQEEFLNRDGITEETLVEEMKKWSESRPQSKYRSGCKPSKGEWYYVSDSSVDKSSWKDVRKQQAYLLFYERLKNTKETKRINNPGEETRL